jgi:hypothetical protein
MAHFVSDGRGGFKQVGGYQSPEYLIALDQQERAKAALETVAAQHFEDLIEVHRDLLETPRFEEKSTVHDWRNHVPLAVQCLWSDMTMRERALIFYLAQIQANTEAHD